MNKPEDLKNKFREENPEIVAAWEQVKDYVVKDVEKVAKVNPPTPKKKKHPWMCLFVIPPKTSEIGKVRYESIAKMKDIKHKLIKNK